MIGLTYSVSPTSSAEYTVIPDNAYICSDGLFRSGTDYRFTHTFTSNDVVTRVTYDD